MKEQPMSNPSMQEEIDRLQTLYREWLNLQPKLEAALADFRRSNELMAELSQFYFEGDYRAFHDRIEQGETVNLHTEGEYSIMSEDALWNAQHDHTETAWAFVRQGLAVVDPANQ